MPFLTAGDPDLDTTAALITEVIARGAHLVEVGIPYSDPVADGPVISASYHRALQRGVRLDRIMAMLAEVRTRVDAPLVTMVSYAIIHRNGATNYLRAAVAAGVDGLIVPDLPIEEADALLRDASAAGLCLIQLVTPTTPPARAARIARTSTGFLYYVSVAGITGERTALPADLVANVERLRAATAIPICIGFGISTPELVRTLAPVADGLIVGSAIVRRLVDMERQPREVAVGAIGDYVKSLSQMLTR